MLIQRTVPIALPVPMATIVTLDPGEIGMDYRFIRAFIERVDTALAVTPALALYDEAGGLIAEWTGLHPAGGNGLGAAGTGRVMIDSCSLRTTGAPLAGGYTYIHLQVPENLIVLKAQTLKLGWIGTDGDSQYYAGGQLHFTYAFDNGLDESGSPRLRK